MKTDRKHYGRDVAENVWITLRCMLTGVVIFPDGTKFLTLRIHDFLCS